MARSRFRIQLAPSRSSKGAANKLGSFRDRRLHCECLEDRRVLAVVTVDSGSDLTNGDTSSIEALLANDGGDGVSLREALEATNATPGSDEVVFATDLSGVTITLGGEELVITDPVTIDARSLDEQVVIDAQGLSRVIHASETSGDVTLAGLTITGGRTTGGYTEGPGGGVRHTGSTLTLTASRVVGNRTEGNSAYGGGISARTLHVENSVFASNYTTGYSSRGGAVSAWNLAISNSEFVGNHTSGRYAYGGATRSFNLVVHASTFDSNHTLGDNSSGGAVYQIAGDATITDSSLTGNYTQGLGATGGGFAARGYGAEILLVENTSITGNYTLGANAPGGGLSAYSTRFELRDSTLTDNRTQGPGAPGGGLYVRGVALLDRTVVSSNATLGERSGGGGAYFLDSGTYFPDDRVRIVASLISGNSTAGEGAAGGGVLAYRGEFDFVQSTISGNTTSGVNSQGGGFAASSSRTNVSLSGTTVTNNSASHEYGQAGGLWLSQATASISGSIVAGNSAGARYADLRLGSSRNTVTYSLLGDNEGTSLLESLTPDAAGNLIGSSTGTGPLDPGLDALANNGGPTQTHALQTRSSAVDAGDATEHLSFDRFDQRGDSFLRVSGGRIDLGAFESQLNVLVVDTAFDDFDGNYQPGDLSLREAVQLANETPGHDLIAFDPSLSGQTLSLTRGELEITESLVIDASSLPERPTIDARLRSRVFNIATTSGDFLFRGLNLIGGSTANHADPLTDSGGAIRSETLGLVSLQDTTLSGNRTSGAWAHGGAIYAVGDLHLVQSTISNNRTEGDRSSGGAIAAYGNVTIDRSTVAENQAIAMDAIGGGIWLASGDLTLDGSILAGNSAGGGQNDLGLGWGAVVARYSLVGDTNGSSGPDNPLVAALALGQGNLFSTAGPVDAGLAPLADNGGGVLTHALLPGSPASNAGDPAVSASGYDQRGTPFGRVADGALDIGAYETQALALEVDNLADKFDADYSEGQLSLREAVLLANRNPGLDTITFATALSGQTIALANGEIEITDDLSIDGAGLEERLTIDAQSNSRVFNFTAEVGDLTISRLVVTGGLTTNDNPRVSNGEEPLTTHNGGAIRSHSSGLLSLREVSITNSRTTGNGAAGGGVFTRGAVELVDSVLTDNSTRGYDAPGGGLFAAGSIRVDRSEVASNYTTGYFSRGGGVSAGGQGTLITSSVIRDNFASQTFSAGGGVNSNAGVTVEDSIIEGNHVRGDFGAKGGGIAGDSVVLTRSRVTGNRVESRFGNGGGISARYISVTDSTLDGNVILGEHSRGGAAYALSLAIEDSTVSNNSADGVESTAGGLFVRGAASLVDSTISGNQAIGSGSRGGGLFHTGEHPIYDTLLIEQSTITNNSASRGGGVWEDWKSLQIMGSILAANVAEEAPDLYVSEDAATTLDYNLFGDNTGTPFTEAQQPDDRGNLIGSAEGGGLIYPVLAPLGDNGGPTLTHALLPDSPAIEAGDPQASSSGYDQRGEPFDRVSGRRIDMGAFEALTLYVDTAIDEDDGDHSWRDLSLREAIGIANAAPGFDLIRFDTDLSGRTILLEGEELLVSDAVAIDASALNLGLTINAQSRSRVLAISETSGDVALNGLALTGGQLVGEPYAPYFNSYGIETSGGGIRSLTEAELTLTNVTISGNRVEGYQSRGGGVFARGPVTLLNSEVSDNLSEGRDAAGGGVYALDSLRVESSTIQRNRTEGLRASGGGVHSVGDTELIDSSIIENSTAGQLSTGGGIDSLAGLSATRSEIGRNRTAGAGSQGGGANVADLASFTNSLVRDNRTEGGGSPGGGVHAGALTLIQSTVSGNYTIGAGSDGGGIASDGDAQITQSTIVNNHALSNDAHGGGVAAAGTLSLEGTVIAENTAGSEAPDLWTATEFGVVRYSFVGDKSGTALTESPTPDALGNWIGDSAGSGTLDPRLGPLVQNGGLLASHRPMSGSPLINAGDPGFETSNGDPSLPNDIRGPFFPRVIEGRIDIGAVEEIGRIVVDSLSSTADGDLSTGQLSIREAAELANANPGHDTITFDASLSGGTILLGGAELLFTEAITIDATSLNAGITLDAEQQSRVVNLTASFGDSTLAGLHLTRGLTTKSNQQIIQPYLLLHDGGAVRSVSSGDLTLDQTRVTDSGTEGSYTKGGGVYTKGHVRLIDSVITGNRSAGWWSYGGGVASRRVTAVRSTLSDNSTHSGGGGIFAISNATIEQSTLTGNSSSYFGGAVKGHVVSITGSTLSSNSASSGGAVDGDTVSIMESTISSNIASSDGGGVRARSLATVIDSTVSANTASGRGGAIYSYDGAVEVSHSDLTDNQASRGAGAIDTASASITDSYFSRNRGESGGAVAIKEQALIARSLFDQNHSFGFPGGGAVSGPNLTVETSTFTGNYAENRGSGGAILSTNGLHVSTSTFSNNRAMETGGPSWRTAQGGAISVTGDAAIYDSTFVDNEASSGATLDVPSGSTLVEGSILTSSLPSTTSLGAGAELVINHSLIDTRVTPTGGAGNVVSDSAGLGPLADNGGPTPTHQPLPGSPVINAGDPLVASDPKVFDQRGEGFLRVAGPRIDFGAVEVQLAAPSLVGDYNRDSVVDAADYTVWRDAEGTPREPFDGPDGDGDGQVTTADLTLWRSNYGARIDDTPETHPPIKMAPQAPAESATVQPALALAPNNRPSDRVPFLAPSGGSNESATRSGPTRSVFPTAIHPSVRQRLVGNNAQLASFNARDRAFESYRREDSEDTDNTEADESAMPLGERFGFFA